MSIYYHCGTYAREHGELDLFRESARENLNCCRAIESAIAEAFDGWTLGKSCLARILEKYDAERIALVLAATLCDREYDGRFSSSNKAWSRSVKLPEVPAVDGYRPMYILTTHPAVLNGFVNLFRKETNQ